MYSKDELIADGLSAVSQQCCLCSYLWSAVQHRTIGASCSTFSYILVSLKNWLWKFQGLHYFEHSLLLLSHLGGKGSSVFFKRFETN